MAQTAVEPVYAGSATQDVPAVAAEPGVVPEAAEAEAAPDIGLLFEHALVDPPATFDTDLAELRRIVDG